MKTLSITYLTIFILLVNNVKAQQPQAIHNIQLQEGYSLVSTYVSPADPDLMVLLDDLLDDGSLEFVRNSSGQMFHKVGSVWINSIGNWNTQEGYLFFMNNTAGIPIEGELFDPVTPLSLNEGYQFASYYYTEYIDALQACSGILDIIDFIRNSEGQVLRKIGPYWVNNIGDLRYGEGYLIKMNEAGELIYFNDTIFNCPAAFIDPRDGQEYNAVMIGSQCWMAENINTGQKINGSQSQGNNGIIEKFCYDNDSVNCEIYGGLYQWEEMMDYTTIEGSQGICLTGWHIATDEEWKQLEGEVDSQYGYPDPEWDEGGDRGYDAGLNLRSDTGWIFYNGTDPYGFAALPGGNYSTWNNGSYYNLTHGAIWWTSTTHYVQSTAKYRELYWPLFTVFRSSSNFNGGFYARCIKDHTVGYH
ncbi:MAG: hypothetical protein JEY97_05220 [Bacteroidales bacterium]|nr:hypothetical protein [Bacteroidales bacterium]